MSLGRRKFLKTISGAAALSSLERLLAEPTASGDLVAIPGGTFIRNVRLGRFDGRPEPELGRLLGTGLDARQFVDISSLSGDSLITSAERFFVRTSASGPNAAARLSAWNVSLGGLVRREVVVPVASLADLVRPCGTHLLECSGNADPANFGLISTARWAGIPLLPLLLDRMQPSSENWRVRVTGLDDEETPSRSSVPGAGWVFSREDLARTRAFLAMRMNEAPLTPDHGFPVRLVVPGWYGCSCIKWVSRIDLVADDEPATGQMKEFAGRTHQNGVPALARDYEPPAIDLAAMPIRVEQWRLADGASVYRVVGVRWGGSGSVSQSSQSCGLTIRFRHNDAFVPVGQCDPSPGDGTSWSLWSHLWRPDSPGRYQIVLGSSDPSVRTRRLDLRYYTRDVEIYG